MKRIVVCAWLVVAACVSMTLAADSRRELHFPNLPGQHTLRCDLHTHTVFSDGQVWPSTRVEEAWREGLDAIAITDHIEYQPKKADVKTNHNRPYELAVGRARERNILLVRGAEITRDTPPGHFNAIFLKDVDPLDTKDLDEVFRLVAGQGAFLFWNHPGWQGPERGRWGDVQTRAFEAGQLRGIEICNGDEYYADAHRWAVEKGLTVLGNSDIHEPSLDRPPTPAEHRTLTLVFARERNVPALQEALVAGRTAVWCENRLFGPERILTALFAASLEIRPPHHRTKDAVWFEIANRCELNLELAAGANGRLKITLPANSVSSIKLDVRLISGARELPCRVLNLLTAPDTPLQTRLAVPADPGSASQAAGG